MQQESRSTDASHERRHAWETLYDSATMRMVELMGGHEWIRWHADLINALWQPRSGKGFAFGDAAD